MMRISDLEKRVLEKQKKKNTNENNKSGAKKHRFLIIVNVLGSAGPIKYLVNGDDSVAAVIHTALKLYARHGRLPLLGSDVNKCLLYPSKAGAALNPHEMIGECGGRNFLLCKKQSHQQMTEMRSEMIAQKKSAASCWKALMLSISSPRSTRIF